MSEIEAPFSVLRQSSDAEAVAAIERLVREAPDDALNKVNAIDLAAKEGLDEERVVGALLHAARLGLFEMSWNVICQSCGGTLDANASLKTLNQPEYRCAFCAAAYETTLDHMVEVTFAVSARLRKIAAHDPDEMPAAEYYRQVFWSSGIDLPTGYEQVLDEVTLDLIELPQGERAILSLQLPAGFLIVFDPVTHAAQFLDVKGEATVERQNLALVLSNVRTPTASIEMRPGPLRLALEIAPLTACCRRFG